MEAEAVASVNGQESTHAGTDSPIDVSVLTPKPPVRYVSRVTGESFASEMELQQHYAQCKLIAPNQMVVTPEFQNYIPAPPRNKESLRATFTQNDEITVNSWFEEWRANKIANLARYDVLANSVQSEHGKFGYRPVVISGAGPSLKKNGHLLKDRGQMGLVACLHTYAFYLDRDVPVDYFVNLDAGDITIPEMAQGGKRPESWYWDASKDYTLVTPLHGNPKLHERWKGKILWFDTPLSGMNESIPDERLKDFRVVFQTGGNTLGAAQYLAKGILGGSPIIFVGADFSFSHERKFHPFDSPYDKQYAGLIPVTDVFGYRTATWPSYYGFKCWFDHLAAFGGQSGNTPGTYINATEGGCLGAYTEGNIMQIQQRRLADVLAEYKLHTKLPAMLSDKSRFWVLY